MLNLDIKYIRDKSYVGVDHRKEMGGKWYFVTFGWYDNAGFWTTNRSITRYADVIAFEDWNQHGMFIGRWTKFRYQIWNRHTEKL
jgi:hypothetical protein